MRYVWMIFGVIVLAMLALLPRLGHRGPAPAAGILPAQQVAQHVAYSPTGLAPSARPDLAKADSIVAFGLAQRGTPYVWAGISPLTGFDCSGFILYTFAHFGVPVPHSTALLIDVGRPVARAEAQAGDIIVFTGTDKTSTTPGHAGIIISRRGELPLRFVHASSSRREPFVKVSQVEDSDYERRFMQVRRVLGPGTGVVATARANVPGTTPAATVRSTAAVGALPIRPAAVTETAVPVTPLPTVLPKRPVSRRVAARKPKAARKPAATPASARKATVRAVTKKAITPTAKPRSTTAKAVTVKKKRTTRR